MKAIYFMHMKLGIKTGWEFRNVSIFGHKNTHMRTYIHSFTKACINKQKLIAEEKGENEKGYLLTQGTARPPGVS